MSFVTASLLRRLTGSQIIVLCLALCIATAALGVSVQSWFASAGTAGRENQTRSQTKPSPARIETELVTLRRHGFEPREITRPADPFVLAVDNRSGIEEMALRLDRVAGNRLKEVNVPRKKLDWRDAFDLPPGRYLLTEANNPDWVCSITITAK